MNIIPFPGETSLDIQPNTVLEAAKEKLQDVVLIGHDKETGQIYFASSTSDGHKILMLIERAKHILM